MMTVREVGELARGIPCEACFCCPVHCCNLCVPRAIFAAAIASVFSWELRVGVDCGTNSLVQEVVATIGDYVA